MKPILFRSTSFFFILSIVLTSNVFAQRLALFETFTGASNPCVPQQENAFEDAAFIGSSSTASEDASKIVHLNYYLGIGGAAGLDDDGFAVDLRLSGEAAIYTSAVDRQVFSQTGERVDPTNVGDYSDWGAQINADAGSSAEATVTLNYATLDKTDSGGLNGTMKLHADMTVTANTTIGDSLIIRYAITQDGVSVTECGAKTATTFNDMAWHVTTSNGSNYVVCTPSTGLSAGDTVHVTWDYSIDVSNTLYQKIQKMKFIAFLEDQGSPGSGNYFVANAAILKKDLDTLQAPTPTLTLTDSTVDGKTFGPGATPEIQYTSTNLPDGTNAYYSLDNGAKWHLIADSLGGGSFNWTVPDSLTTQGKFKLVAANDTNIVSIQDGNFSIAVPPSVTFIAPPPNTSDIKFKGDSIYTIYWTKVGVDSALLKYSLDNGATFTALQNNADTFYVWHVPDTARGVVIQLVPDNKAVPTAAVIDTIVTTITIPQGVVANSITPSGLTITNIFPNPASNGEDIEVQYAEAQPKPIIMQLLDLLGRVMPENYTTDNLAIHLNTGSLAAGAYVVRLSDGTNVVSKRIEIIR